MGMSGISSVLMVKLCFHLKLQLLKSEYSNVFVSETKNSSEYLPDFTVLSEVSI